jgi:transcriptional regulator GlxA family with amidase domain
VVEAQRPLEFAEEADAVVIGSGMRTGAIAADAAVMGRIRLDPARQLIASQCSGALMLDRLGLLPGRIAATDLATRPALEACGIGVVEGAFHAAGNVATAGGCLSSQYIATWMIGRRLGLEAAQRVIHYVAPVGEKDAYVTRALDAVRPFLDEAAKSAA